MLADAFQRVGATPFPADAVGCRLFTGVLGVLCVWAADVWVGFP
jgi:hypothetical protein